MLFVMRDVTGTTPRGSLRLAGGATAAVALAAIFGLGGAPAYAAGSQTIPGNMTCSQPLTAYMATESTARGTSVEHALQKVNNTGQLERVRLGSSTSYTRWGWTFWRNQTGGFVAIGNGSSGAVKAGTLTRWCTTMPTPW